MTVENKSRVFRTLYTRLANRCKSKGFETPSPEEFASWISPGGILTGRCAMTGLFSNRILRDRNNPGEKFESVVGILSADRIDNEKGYTKDNIQGVLQPINLMRGSLTVLDFQKLCVYVTQHLSIQQPELYQKYVDKYTTLLAGLNPSDYKEEDVEKFVERSGRSESMNVVRKFHAKNGTGSFEIIQRDEGDFCVKKDTGKSKFLLKGKRPVASLFDAVRLILEDQEIASMEEFAERFTTKTTHNISDEEIAAFLEKGF